MNWMMEGHQRATHPEDADNTEGWEVQTTTNMDMWTTLWLPCKEVPNIDKESPLKKRVIQPVKYNLNEESYKQKALGCW